MIFCDAKHLDGWTGIYFCLLLLVPQDELQYSLPFATLFRRLVANPCISVDIKVVIESTGHKCRSLEGPNWSGIGFIFHENLNAFKTNLK